MTSTRSTSPASSPASCATISPARECRRVWSGGTSSTRRAPVRRDLAREVAHERAQLLPRDTRGRAAGGEERLDGGRRHARRIGPYARPVRTAIARYVPAARWLPGYERRWLRFDVLAGVAVWAVLTPQAIAYASLAGAPPAAGFYAATAAVLGYALLGTCKELSVGPSSTPAITAASIVTAASVASNQVPGLLAGLAVVSGVVMVASGFLRLGFIADFLSRPVLVGFVTGIAIDIIVGQLPKLLGVPGGNGNSFDKAWTLLHDVADTDWRTLAVGLIGLAVLVVLQRFAPALPAALIVVAGSVAASRVLDLAGKGVAVVADLPSTLPSLALPHIGFDNVSLVLGGGLALAFISYAESIGAARSMARRNGYEVDPNQELIALGGGNVLGGFLQGFPTDASLSRTSVADTSGVRSPLYGLVVLVMLIVTILWLTPFFDGLPQATLAAVIIGSIYRLVDVAGLRHLRRIDPGRLRARRRRGARRAHVRRAGRDRDGRDRVARRADRQALPAERRDARPRARGGAGRGHPVPGPEAASRLRDVPRARDRPLRRRAVLCERHLPA